VHSARVVKTSPATLRRRKGYEHGQESKEDGEEKIRARQENRQKSQKTRPLNIHGHRR
jgi:hypothetical protein